MSNMASVADVIVEIVPTSQIELSVSCRNLADMDYLSKSDPMCVLFVVPFREDTYQEFGRTEVIWDNLNPDFVTKFTLDYNFHRIQKLKFEIYDIDSDQYELYHHDFLGTMQCTLAEIVSSEVSLKRPLNGPHECCGDIIVTFEELIDCKDQVTFQFSAQNLDKKNIFGLSNPFLNIRRVNVDKSFTLVYRTETIMTSLNPEWQPSNIAVRSLCNVDYDRQLKIECFNWNKSGSHELIGEFSTTLNELLRGPRDFECVNRELQEKKGKKYTNSGIVKLLMCTASNYSFLDYIRSGAEVQCIVAIDFTSLKTGARQVSGHFTSSLKTGARQSGGLLLHSDGDEPCLYVLALRSVVEIVQEYDTDKKIPAIGFGCKVPPDWRPSSVYLMEGDAEHVECNGIDGVLAAYHKAVKTLRSHSPTSFAPLVNYVAGLITKQKERTESEDTYFILLILTDGKATDMPQTIDALVKASSLPLSIIIVGIGDGKFDDMEVLDGDSVRLSSNGCVAVSDIVQFVPFRDFIGGKHGSNIAKSKQLLAREVLAEVPDQFVSYMMRNGVKPRVMTTS